MLLFPIVASTTSKLDHLNDRLSTDRLRFGSGQFYQQLGDASLLTSCSLCLKSENDKDKKSLVGDKTQLPQRDIKW